MTVQRVKVLLAECPNGTGHSPLADALRRNPKIELVDVVTDGHSVLRAMRQYEVDLLLLDLVLAGMDGIEVLQAIKNMKLPKSPAVILCTALASESIINQAAKLGAIHCLLRPANVDWIVTRAMEIFQFSQDNMVVVNGKIFPVSEVRNVIAKYMHEVGVPSHLKGYSYIRDALFWTVRQPEMLYAVTTELYPAIAADFDTQPARVERVIRHAIEATWRRGDLNHIDRLFGYSVAGERGRPTNTEFLARITDDILMRF